MQWLLSVARRPLVRWRAELWPWPWRHVGGNPAVPGRTSRTSCHGGHIGTPICTGCYACRADLASQPASGGFALFRQRLPRYVRCMIVAAFVRSLPQIGRPAVLRVLVRSLALTLAIFAVLAVGTWFGLKQGFAWMGWASGGLAEAAAATVIALLLGWLLFRTVAMAVLSLFSDEIVAAVESRDYPAAATRARPLSFAAGIPMGLRSAARALGWNLLALPLYLALLVTGIGTIALFLALNAYLLGRDLADMVESRHPGMARFGAGQRFVLGFVSALMFLVPIANLLAPIVSAAMAVHLFHGRAEAKGG